MYTKKNKNHLLKINNIIKLYKKKLLFVKIHFAYLEIIILLQCILKKSKIEIIFNKNNYLSKNELNKFKYLLSRRLKGIPITYLIKKKYFFNLNLCTNNNSFIPRSETEILIEKSLFFLKKTKISKTIIDCCTGSGSIALAISKNIKKIKIIAIDINKKSISIAKKNINRYKINHKIILQKSYFLNSIKIKSNLIISNPPYVKKNNKYSLIPNLLSKEPNFAIIGNIKDSTLFHQKIINRSKNILYKNQILLMEIAYNQKYLIKKIKHSVFFKKIIKKDYSKKNRIIILKKLNV
jgi:release factor glutamine methyltransferase